MTPQTITVDAVFQDGVLRPLKPLPLKPQQKVTLHVVVPSEPAPWPADVAQIYQEIADEDRKLANAIWADVKATWPSGQEKS
jgi:predicted DNA-binding antitoxin AbrB/MazE fold protein